MKILESQNALLSNYEVYQHIADQRKRNTVQNRRVPGPVHHVMTEVGLRSPTTSQPRPGLTGDIR
jgi:hypothetical protein